MPCFRTRGIGASLFKPFWWDERARRRADRTSSRTPNHWQSLQPVFRIIFSNDGALSDFSSAQAARFEFLICFGSTRTVAFAELGNAHRSLQSTAPLLNDGHVVFPPSTARKVPATEPELSRAMAK
jgi:hypothetical protein